jgi:hypothetical protein
LDKVLFKLFTAVHFEGKPMTEHMVIEKAESFYDEVEIKILKNRWPKGISQWYTTTLSCAAQA